jgi:signal transduction histidine kinase
MKLRSRFALAALLLAETSLLVTLGVQHALERRHLERTQRGQQETSLRRLARVAQDASLEQNEVFLLNYLKVLKGSPDIHDAALVDEGGLVRVHTAMFDGAPVIGVPWDGPPHEGADVRVAAARRGGRELEQWSLPMSKGERPAGAVYIGFDRAVLGEAVARDLAESRRPLLLTGLVLSLLAWLGAAWLARNMTAPLAALHEGAERLGAGELEYRIQVPRRDELGDLAAGFNRMAAELEQMNKFKEQLMASITHDLRSPLSAIQGHAEILLTDAEATEQERRESAELIRENAGRMAAMANDLTDLVKLQMGRLELTLQPVRVGEALETTRRLLDVIAKRLDVRLEARTEPGLPEVRADATHLQRVLTNLVSNALKFTPSAGRVALEAVAEPHHVRVTVSDTGLGIPQAKLESLFTRFTGAEGVQKGRGGLATGLGLSICREIVERHGGRIWAESEMRKGTRVHFTLPRGEDACSGAC